MKYDTHVIFKAGDMTLNGTYKLPLRYSLSTNSGFAPVGWKEKCAKPLRLGFIWTPSSTKGRCRLLQLWLRFSTWARAIRFR